MTSLRSRAADSRAVPLRPAVGAVVTAVVLVVVAALAMVWSDQRLQAQATAGARLASLAAGHGAAVNDDLAAGLGRLLSSAGSDTLRRLAIDALSAGQSVDLADWAAREGLHGGTAGPWLLRPSDLVVIASAGGSAPPPSRVAEFREASGSDPIRVGRPRIDPARARVSVLAIAPVRIGQRLLAWLLTDLQAPLPVPEQAPAGFRWQVPTDGTASDELEPLLADLGEAVPVSSVMLGPDESAAAVRLGLHGSVWHLVARARPGPPALGGAAWRLALVAFVLVVCAALVLARFASRRPMAPVETRVRDGAGPAGIAQAGPVTPARIEAAVVPADVAGDAVQGTGAPTDVARVARDFEDLVRRGDYTARLEADGTSLGEPLNAALAHLQASASALGEQASLAVNAAHEIEAEFDQADAAFGTQRQVLGEVLTELDRLRQGLARSADGSQALHQAARRLRRLQTDGGGSMDAATDALAGASRLLSATEKRIKLFGERSQEIGEIVGILLTIAERTRVAALNASLQTQGAGSFEMQGEFSDEVRRLSDSARESADQIRRQAEVIRRETAAVGVAVNEALDEIERVRGSVAEDARALGSALTSGERALRAIEQGEQPASEALRLTDGLLERLRTVDGAAEAGARALRRQHGQVQRLNDSARALLARLAPGRGATP